MSNIGIAMSPVRQLGGNRSIGRPGHALLVGAVARLARSVEAEEARRRRSK
jgi:hypothetical protein